MVTKNSFFKKKYLSKLKFLLVTCCLLYFFSNSLIYAQSITKDEDKYLIPLGHVVQIDIELKNVIVRNQIQDSPFIVGDAILAINDIAINNYGDFSNILLTLSPNYKMSVLVLRGDNKYMVEATKSQLESININALLSGFATLTYVDPNTLEFGAVAHPISVGTFRKIDIKNGSISSTTDVEVQKSCRGSVGSIRASHKNLIGNFNINNEFGIRGKIVDLDTSKLKSYKVASLNEVKTGKAQVIFQTSSDEIKKFDIEILDIQKQRSPQAKTFKIKITDKDLLNYTGGVVQGMSGTPIIQDDKIVGAISHAVENDPTIGYGVFIEWMINGK